MTQKERTEIYKKESFFNYLENGDSWAFDDGVWHFDGNKWYFPWVKNKNIKMEVSKIIDNVLPSIGMNTEREKLRTILHNEITTLFNKALNNENTNN